MHVAGRNYSTIISSIANLTYQVLEHKKQEAERKKAEKAKQGGRN
ncbi:MAG: hypothetical protein Q7S33_04010 [Nanoarchaeota archaeon]|nr:hypothetical protein [Nanoarchaeota archaeon]